MVSIEGSPGFLYQSSALPTSLAGQDVGCGMRQGAGIKTLTNSIANLLCHVIEATEAARADAASRLAVGDAAHDATALARGQVGRIGVAAVRDWPSHIALARRLRTKNIFCKQQNRTGHRQAKLWHPVAYRWCPVTAPCFAG